MYRCLYLQTLNTTAREELSRKRTLSETNLELSSVVRLLEHRDYEPIGKKYYSHLKYKFTHIEAFTHITTNSNSLLMLCGLVASDCYECVVVSQFITNDHVKDYCGGCYCGPASLTTIGFAWVPFLP